MHQDWLSSNISTSALAAASLLFGFISWQVKSISADQYNQFTSPLCSLVGELLSVQVSQTCGDLTWISSHSEAFASLPVMSVNAFLYSSCNAFGTFSTIEKESMRVGTKGKTLVRYSKSELLSGFPAVDAMMAKWFFSFKSDLFASEITVRF